jgi:hypothetical protein
MHTFGFAETDLDVFLSHVVPANKTPAACKVLYILSGLTIAMVMTHITSVFFLLMGRPVAKLDSLSIFVLSWL